MGFIKYCYKVYEFAKPIAKCYKVLTELIAKSVVNMAVIGLIET